MDKYQLAILEHERCRMEVTELTGKIFHAANYVDPDPSEPHQGGSKCDDPMIIKGKIMTCIDSLWEQNKEKTYAHDCYGIGHPADNDWEPIKLCPSCTEVEKLVIERKAAKQKFGVAKRRIGQLARGLAGQTTIQGNMS